MKTFRVEQTQQGLQSRSRHLAGAPPGRYSCHCLGARLSVGLWGFRQDFVQAFVIDWFGQMVIEASLSRAEAVIFHCPASLRDQYRFAELRLLSDSAGKAVAVHTR